MPVRLKYDLRLSEPMFESVFCGRADIVQNTGQIYKSCTGLKIRGEFLSTWVNGEIIQTTEVCRFLINIKWHVWHGARLGPLLELPADSRVPTGHTEAFQEDVTISRTALPVG